MVNLMEDKDFSFMKYLTCTIWILSLISQAIPKENKIPTSFFSFSGNYLFISLVS